MQDKLPRVESRGAATTSSQQDVEPILAGQFQGHPGGVTALAYSDDGRVLVTAGKDGTLKSVERVVVDIGAYDRAR